MQKYCGIYYIYIIVSISKNLYKEWEKTLASVDSTFDEIFAASHSFCTHPESPLVALICTLQPGVKNPEVVQEIVEAVEKFFGNLHECTRCFWLPRLRECSSIANVNKDFIFRIKHYKNFLDKDMYNYLILIIETYA